ncbi:hypothetical protein AX16_001395 [Volvariella volvacea WC 439]|nr:hypothetical protein AX16_001395 [Volvariella volvacea WC 439]
MSTVLHNPPFPMNHDIHDDSKDNIANSAFTKGPKRKRLAKACDACHKSKRRCDGTAPCSNCYYASKSCTYTDASGRPVPAPRAFERSDPQSSLTDHSPLSRQPPHVPQSSMSSGVGPIPYGHPTAPAHHHVQTNTYPKPVNPDLSEDESKQRRKRQRGESGQAIPVAVSEDRSLDGPIGGVTMDRPAPVELDHALTNELTNLFFTHCHPARAIIHKPTFTAALSHNRVPLFLLHAVCALAAPLSKHPKIRTTPARFAGKPFAQEALVLMFDGAGRLVCKKDLASAQALCLLQIYNLLTKDENMMWNSRYHDLAIHIVESLGVHVPEHPTLTPMPSPEFIQAAIERECIRRIFWLIHLMDVLASIYFKKPISVTEDDLKLRLPVDESSFELAVHSTLPEYLHLPPVRTQYASEFGHLIRVLRVYAKVEYALVELNDPEATINPVAILGDGERQIETWAKSLPEHLRFSESSLSYQQSMFETSSNTGAWCYCFMHVLHASCVLALNQGWYRLQHRSGDIPQWAANMLDQVLTMLGDRAKNSILMGSAVWSLVKYCKRDDEQMRQWAKEYQDFWGTKMAQIAASERRSQPSPPLPSIQPPSLQRQPLSLPPPPQQPSAHRRSSEGRPYGSTSSNPSVAVSRPQHGGDVSYGSHRRSPGSPTGQLLEIRSQNANGQHSGSANGTYNSIANNNSVLRHNPIATSQHLLERDRERDGEMRGPGPMTGTATSSGSALGLSHGVNEIARDKESQTSGLLGSSNPQQQTLPSLKSSGLLEWQRSPRRASPVPALSQPPSLHTPSHYDAESARPAAGMPVGLPWLANETR